MFQTEVYILMGCIFLCYATVFIQLAILGE